MSKLKIILIIFLFLPVTMVFGKSKSLGYLLSYEGKVFILRSKLIKKEKGMKVKYQNKDFYELKAKKYLKLYSRDRIVTLENSKAKMLLNKAQMIFVAPLTNMAIKDFDAGKGGDSKTIAHVVFGKLRSIVKKKKERKFEVQTRSAVMGVRGTDFLVEHSPFKKKTSLTTIKGKVSMAKVLRPKKPSVAESVVEKPVLTSKPIEVKEGYTSDVVEVKAPKKIEEPRQEEKPEKAERVQEEAVPDAKILPEPESPTVVEITAPKPAPIENLVEAAKISIIKESKEEEEEPEEEEKKAGEEDIKKEELAKTEDPEKLKEAMAKKEKEKEQKKAARVEEARAAKAAERDFIKDYTGKDIAKTPILAAKATVVINSDLKKLIKEKVESAPVEEIDVETSKFVDSFLNDKIDETF